MLEFKNPKWLKERLGKVNDRIGKNGSIKIDHILENKVFLKLSRDDDSFEVIPASITLSELIISKKVLIEEIKEFEIFELSSGYICISQIVSYDVKDFL